jgi:uncharacterized membrane protein YhfC
MVRIVLIMIIATIPCSALPHTLLDYEGHETPEKDSSYYEFEFQISENGSRMVMDMNSRLAQGELNIWFGGAGYQIMGNYTGTGSFEYTRQVFGPLNDREPVTVRITALHAVGEWEISFREISRKASLFSLLVSGLLVVLLTMAVTSWSKRYLQIPWKWLFVGAGAWFVGVVLKFVAAYSANTPVLQTVKSSLGNLAYLTFGSIYIGLLTGIFEIGMTLVFALLIRNMWGEPENALGVGLGAGLVEALLIGLSSIGSFVTATTGSPSADAIAGAVAQAAVLTPILWLVSSIERMIAILCHASSRILVLFALAHRKQRYFWAGFLILTTIDAIAGYYHISGLINKISAWWAELLMLPLAITSIFIIMWCFRRWRN